MDFGYKAIVAKFTIKMSLNKNVLNNNVIFFAKFPTRAMMLHTV